MVAATGIEPVTPRYGRGEIPFLQAAMVRGGGLEPPRDFSRRFISPTRLPISSPSCGVRRWNRTNVSGTTNRCSTIELALLGRKYQCRPDVRGFGILRSTVELISRGSQSWVRTSDRRLNRAQLYQLSYLRMVQTIGIEPISSALQADARPYKLCLLGGL